MHKKISVIIPIYNAPDDLKKCLDSLCRHTDFSKVKVILIDDHSSDPGVDEILQHFKDYDFLIHKNKENRGFSHNVNFGFSHSDGDVILLNTDTIVTKDWIDKLEKCAYSDPFIGTVTPFSNSATICSIPYFCRDNTLPNGFTVDSFGELVESCSFHMYPEIPVGIGFCMYIKREAIDGVGLFDEKAFGRGYGEENDFCYRCQLRGLKHVLCDDLFIYHSGTSSFATEEKLILIEEHEHILEQRYPALVQETREFVKSNPLWMLQKNIKLRMLLTNKKKSILYVLHRDFRDDSFDSVGGTQYHVRDLTDVFRREFNVFVLARNMDYLVLTLYSDDEITFNFYVGKSGTRVKYRDEHFADIYNLILSAFKIDLIHVHHLYDMSFDIFDIARKKNIPIYMTIHDYYCICPRVKMLDEQYKVCVGKENSDKCQICLQSQSWFSEYIYGQKDFLLYWRNQFRNCFAICNAVFVPSNIAKDIFTIYYPEFKNKTVVIPHACYTDKQQLLSISLTEVTNVETSIESISENGDEYIICGWSVGLNQVAEEEKYYIELVHKDVTYEYQCKKTIRQDIALKFGNSKYLACGFKANVPKYAIENAQSVQILHVSKHVAYLSPKVMVNIVDKSELRYKTKDKGAAFHIAFVGGMTVEKGSRIVYEMIQQHPEKDIKWFLFGGIGDSKLAGLDQKNFNKIGRYRRNDILSLFKENKIDLVCLPAIWPETFCYVLSEALSGKVPVVATDVGALGERIKENGIGWLVPLGSNANEYMDLIFKIKNNREEMNKTRNRISECCFITVDEMREMYVKYYQFCENECLYLNNRSIQELLKMEINGMCDNQKGKYLVEQIKMLEEELYTIKNTKGYKMIEIFRKYKFKILAAFK